MVGKAVEQNNIDSIVYLTPLTEMLEKENLENIKTYDEFINKYKEYLKEYTINFVKELNEITWEEAPLLSLLTDNCNEKLEAVAEQGKFKVFVGGDSVNLLEQEFELVLD